MCHAAVTPSIHPSIHPSKESTCTRPAKYIKMFKCRHELLTKLQSLSKSARVVLEISFYFVMAHLSLLLKKINTSKFWSWMQGIGVTLSKAKGACCQVCKVYL